MRTTRNIPKSKNEEGFGLAAIGSSGCWEVAIDETTSGVRKWFAQIEGRSVYLYFAVKSPRVIEKMLDFLTTDEKGLQNALAPRPGELANRFRGGAVSNVGQTPG